MQSELPRRLALTHALDVTGTPHPLVDLHAVHPPPPSTSSAIKQTMWKASRRYNFAPPQPKHSAASEVQFDSGAHNVVGRRNKKPHLRRAFEGIRKAYLL